MSKEITAEEYRDTCYIKNDYQKIMYGIQLNHYKELVAKEAVKEFAEELMKFIQPLSTSQSITNYVNILLEQKGVKI